MRQLAQVSCINVVASCSGVFTGVSVSTVVASELKAVFHFSLVVAFQGMRQWGTPMCYATNPNVGAVGIGDEIEMGIRVLLFYVVIFRL